MKVEIEKEKKGFKPFKLTLTVESEDELKWLYHMFNVGYGCLEEIIDEDSGVSIPKKYPDKTNAWEALKEKCIELGIYKY